MTPKKNLIFIPGLGYTKTLWSKLLKYIPKEDYNILTLDLPSYGEIYKGKQLNFETFAFFLKDKLRESEFKPPYVLIGHSLGGYISLEYCLTFPDQVEKLVIISSPLRKQNSHSPLSFKILIWIGINIGLVDKIIKKIFYSQNKFMKLTLQKLIPIDAGFLKKSSTKSVALCCRDLLVRNWSHEVSHISQPTLIIYGTQDNSVIKINGTELYENFKNKKVASFPCNHSVAVKYPKRLAKELLSFISS